MSDVVNTTPEAPEDSVSLEAYRALKAEEKATAGEEAKTVKVRDREFRLTPELPAIILLDLGLASDPHATSGEQLRAMRQFLHAAIDPEDVDAFEVYLRTAKPVILMDELTKLVETLVMEVAGRPTE